MKKQQIVFDGWVMTVAYPTINKSLSVDLTKFIPEIRDDLQKHGAKQLYGDVKSGRSASEKWAMVQRKHDALLAGHWRLSSERDNRPNIIEAMTRLKKIKFTYVVAEDAYFMPGPDGLPRQIPEEKLEEWGTHVKVKSEIAKMNAEKAAKQVTKDTKEINIDLD